MRQVYAGVTTDIHPKPDPLALSQHERSLSGATGPGKNGAMLHVSGQTVLNRDGHRLDGAHQNPTTSPDRKNHQ